MAKKKYHGSELFDENATPNSNNMEDLTMQKTQELLNQQQYAQMTVTIQYS